jgi:GNAT superfamily N-acetyltransferase
MRIHDVDTSRRRDVSRFINVPFKLYQNCSQWVPPIVSDARMQLDRRKNPFYQANDAGFFVAEQDGTDVGRICVMEPRQYNDFKGEKDAFFYLFDTVDDEAVSGALFDRAAEWARERGLKTIRGPLGFMAFDGFGMLAKGFDLRPAVGIPYNYAYYPALTEKWGFELEERVLSGYLSVVRMMQDFPPRVLEIADKVRARYGFTIKTFKSKREIRSWVAPRVADLYNRTLTHIAGDPPLSQEQVATVAESMLAIADPELLKFVMKEEEIVGFLFCFLDISAGIQRARGRLMPFGWFHLLRDMKRTNWVNLNGMGILPEYHGMGGTAILYAELYRSMREIPRFEHADIVQISEFNAKSLNELKRFGVDFYKTHHIYRKGL